MTASSTILTYGRDPSLLDTRGWVLERAGFSVLRVSGLTEAEEVVAKGQAALLVLCHTLSPKECQDILIAVENLRPQMKKLLMTANTDVCAAGQGQPTLSAFDGPRALIAMTQKLLESQQSVAP